MKILMCSVYDKASQVFAQPFYTPTRAAAIRSFTDAVGNKESAFCAHPEDYVLFELGVFDDNSGELVTNSSPEKLLTALECVRRE